jgi:hypothetical protein
MGSSRRVRTRAMHGLIKNLPAASLGMCGSQNVFEPWWSSYPIGSAKVFPWSARTLANTKAAYRFLSNERVSEAAILAGHFQSTRDRFLAEQEPVLILHDTTPV